MFRTFSLFSFLLSVFALEAAHHKSDEAKIIFDGKTLDEWTQLNGSATYRVENGAIVGKTNEGSPHSFRRSYKLYGNFELQFVVKLINEELNSGVQIRSNTRGLTEKERARGFKKGLFIGPQVDIEATQ